MSKASDDSVIDGPPSRFWRLLGGRGQGDSRLRQQQQLMAWRDALPRLLVSRPSAEQLLERFCQTGVAHGIAGWIGVFVPTTIGELDLLAASGPAEVLRKPRFSIVADHPYGNSPLGWVWREVRAFYASPMGTSADLRDWEEPLRAMRLPVSAILPLQRESGIWGLLVFLRPENESWSIDAQMLVEAAARQLCDALDQAEEDEVRRLLGEGLSSAFDGVVLTDAYWQVMYVNQSFELMTGYSAPEVLRQKLTILQGPDTSRPELASLHQALQSGLSWKGKLVNYRKDGSAFWNGLNVIPVYAEDGSASHFIGLLRDISQEQTLFAQMEYESRHDRLTGLANRRALDDEMEAALARAQRNQTALAVCMIDLDKFKPINDTLGHEAGDRVLQVVATRLRDSLRRTDYVARLGGDEFVILIEDYGSSLRLDLVLRKIDSAIAEPINLPGRHTVSVHLSMGIARYPEDSADAGTLLRFADQALYHAKSMRSKRRRYWQFYEPVTLLSGGSNVPPAGD
jgi:diguanylate cyclase (GGDEF)-like protein/PAS domain S-box-containing protein